MTWMVSWDEDALDELARIWAAAPDRQAAADAADAIERALRRSPHSLGIDLGTCRQFGIDPLRVRYETIAADCRVRVLEVWRL